MKKLLLSAAALLISISFVAAQENVITMVVDGDTTIVSSSQNDFERREVIIVEDEAPAGNVGKIVNTQFEKIKKGHKKSAVSVVSSIGLGYSGLVQNLSNLSLPEGAEYMSQQWRSINFNLDLLRYHYRPTSYFELNTGLELEVNNFRWEKNMSLMVDNAWQTVPDFSYDARGVKLQKSKLVTTYLNVPVIAKFKVHKFYVYGGLVGGWKIGTYNKIKANSQALNGKHRYHDGLNTRNFHWGYTVGVGFKSFGLYAKYYPQSVFKPGLGPEVQQVNIGVTLAY